LTENPIPGPECTWGDINCDEIVDILDIVAMVNYILSSIEAACQECGDFNFDGVQDILDIVAILNCILHGNCPDSPLAKSDLPGYATEITLHQTETGLTYSADGEIGAILITIEHDDDFVLNIADDNFASGVNVRNGNTTAALIVGPYDEEIFESSGNFKIKEVSAASGDSFIKVNLPEKRSLFKSYPNPFNPVTNIQYEIPAETLVNISVYDMQGRMVTELVNDKKQSGDHVVQWNAQDASSGLYIVKMSLQGKTTTQKVLLLK